MSLSTLTQVLRQVRLPVAVAVAGLAVLATVIAVAAGPESVTGSAPLPQETASETPEPAETSTEDTGALIEARITSYEVFLARDPFEPVIPEPAPEGGAGGTGAPVTSPGTPGTTPTTPATSPTTTPTTSPTTTPTDAPTLPGTNGTDDGCVDDGAVTCDGQTVSLVDVFEDGGTATAVVQIDDTLYEVGVGEVFAANYRVLSIEPPCVTLQYGDDRFSLCEGETVLK